MQPGTQSDMEMDMLIDFCLYLLTLHLSSFNRFYVHNAKMT